tara:strand:+ start:417 stop:794 length:378 start_codon:yes stop_codon:yes gene_type:complete
MNHIQVPVPVLAKIASFVDAVPGVISRLADSQKSASADATKQAQACVSGLVDHAGLLEEKRASFEQFILTQEGAIKTINSLTNKIASLAEELDASKQINLGRPSKKANNSSISDASRVWCETLLN